MANILLSKQGSTTILTVGEKWVYNFVKWCDEFKTRYSQQYNYQRAKCEDPKIIEKWFNSLQIIIMQHGVTQEDIYNFNETSFTIGLIATTKIVTKAEMISKLFLI